MGQEGEWHSMDVAVLAVWGPSDSGRHLPSPPLQRWAHGLPMGGPVGRVPALPELMLHDRDWPQQCGVNRDQDDVAS